MSQGEPQVERIHEAKRLELEEEAQQYKPSKEEGIKKKLGVEFFGGSFIASLAVFSVTVGSDSLFVLSVVTVCFTLAVLWALRFAYRHNAFSGVVASTMFIMFTLPLVGSLFGELNERREQTRGQREPSAAAEPERIAEQERRAKLVGERKPAAPGQDAASQAIVEHFKGSAEPWAKDAMWSTAHTLKIGVINTGRSEDGHALYACEILREKGFRGSYRIVIIDIVRLVNQDEWVELGANRCNL